MTEEGESELICYFCGTEFRARKYFLRHHQAHIDAECTGVEMPDNSWKGTVYSDSSSDEGESDLEALKAEKEKHMKKKKDVKYVSI